MQKEKFQKMLIVDDMMVNRAVLKNSMKSAKQWTVEKQLS